jgi:hypothetical protein
MLHSGLTESLPFPSTKSFFVLSLRPVQRAGRVNCRRILALSTWNPACSSLAVIVSPHSPRGQMLIVFGQPNKGKVHTGDTQLRRSGIRAHASIRRLS